MNNTQTNIINITSSKYKCLSNDSNYGFIEGEIYWPTITHYIEAKKFEGTKYEEDIRLSKTVNQVKRKTQRRNIIVNRPMFIDGGTSKDSDEFTQTYLRKETVYGKKNMGFKIKPNWLRECKNLLQYAITAKFNQHAQLFQILLLTYPNKIVSKKNHSTQPNKDNLKLANYINNLTILILIKLRDNKIHKLAPQERTDFFTRTLSFCPDGDNNLSCNLFKNCVFQHIRKTIIHIIMCIAKMEGYNCIYMEMVDDTIFNVCPRKILKKYNSIKSKSDFIPNITSNYGKDCCETYISGTKDYISNICHKEHLKLSPKNIIKDVSRDIAYFLMWCNLLKKINYIEDKIKKYSSLSKNNINLPRLLSYKKLVPIINIPPSRRKYREKIPSKLR